MIGVDTNVLVRLLVADDGRQAQAVGEFFAQRTGADPAFVSAVVLIESLWVLGRRFGYSRSTLLDALRRMMTSPELNFEHGGRLAEILENADPSLSDIADHLIAWSCEKAGCERTVTFDKRAAKRNPSMELLT
ncbi:putative nucleic-acid-binding protein [Mesorhizobium sp. J18]|uniref:PIN domain-containing protein n=1 Tax=Mesorhizobium sp. J18 TaxID=935263 RepID=UPI001198EF10|nr:type II toxin-antitoxin system VapC family toxin [Mesorhizobium sp. J18]TWG98025.1 putative nucleic-acid-binding protein [Mesorhizobium sp. J18]